MIAFDPPRSDELPAEPWQMSGFLSDHPAASSDAAGWGDVVLQRFAIYRP